MEVSKRNLLNYLNNNVHGSYLRYISQLGSMLQKFIVGYYDLGNNNKFKNDFKILLSEANKLDTDVIPYSAIAKIIYKIYNSYSNVDGIDVFCNRCNILLRDELRKEENGQISSGYKILIKTLENIKLSSGQMDTFYGSQSKSRESLNQISEDINKITNITNSMCKNTDIMSKKTKSLTKEANSIRNKWSSKWFQMKDTIDHFEKNIYGRIISVLGIFITIIVAMFGGLSAISNSIDALTSKNVNIYNIILLSILFSLILLLVLFFLFACVSKLTGDSIKRSKSNNLFVRYPIFSYSITILGLLFLMVLLVKLSL